MQLYHFQVLILGQYLYSYIQVEITVQSCMRENQFCKAMSLCIRFTFQSSVRMFDAFLLLLESQYLGGVRMLVYHDVTYRLRRTR
jgi:hypothetical protein